MGARRCMYLGLSRGQRGAQVFRHFKARPTQLVLPKRDLALKIGDQECPKRFVAWLNLKLIAAGKVARIGVLYRLKRPDFAQLCKLLICGALPAFQAFFAINWAVVTHTAPPIIIARGRAGWSV